VQTLCCGRDDQEIEARAKSIRRTVEDLQGANAVGTPPQLVESLAAWSERGVARIYLQLLDMQDLEQVQLVGAEIAPAMANS
jgi:alkanesulfonate monooxygenase SsuD/methylene tetrahydromethanopterin reductase-like flavin-dependent oxidoreductase (luciferase family)